VIPCNSIAETDEHTSLPSTIVEGRVFKEKKMKARFKFVGALAVRSIPITFGIIAASSHPALATTGSATGALSGIATGVQVVQGAMQLVAGIAGAIGIAIGALHWVQHRDDWFGAGTRVISGVICGVVVGNATAIMSLGGTGVTF
jgi:hypothetical protein